MCATRRGSEGGHVRLAGDVIEHLDFRDFIQRYGRCGTLFYLDPHYWGAEGYYGRALFDRSDFADLVGLLRRLSGLFILSINDRPEIREIFFGFDLEEISTSYSVAQRGAKAAKELIITGPNPT